MRIITTRRFLKKIIIFLLIIILFFFIKLMPTKALVNTNNGKFPDIPTDAKNYMISYTGSINNFFLSYCKNENEVIIPTREALSTGPYPIGYCYNKNTKRNTGYAYRRGFIANGISSSDILSKNVTDFSSFTWGTEQQGSNYTSTTLYKYNSLSRLVILDDYSNYNMGNNLSYVFYTNENIYNNWGNGTTLTDSLIILNKDLFSLNQELSISYEIIKRNGYYDLQLNMENYTGETIQEGKQVFLIDTSTGKQTFISPDVNGLPNRTMTIQVYFPTTYKYQIIDTNTIEVIYEEIINIPSIEYDNFSIKINNINTQNKTINYSYVNNGNTTNFKCYHQIENGSLLEDTNCTDIDNNYTINLTQNKNINFIIKDSENNTIFEESRNFVMTMSSPFIEFKENYEYNLLNIKVLFNRFNTTDYVAKYQINNEQIITIMPTQEQTANNDIYSYIIYNITEKSVIKAFIFDNNNNLIASSTFNVSSTYIQQQNYYNIDSASFKDLFNNLSFKNISSELIDLINRLGNIVLSSRLGIIIFTTFLITLIGLVINLIRR